MRQKRLSSMSHVYGPLRSRRLGWSLGVDPLLMKTCNLNCVYCQLGPTPSVNGKSPSYPPISVILHQLRLALADSDPVDHITISGSGEPTLHEEIGSLIRGIKTMTEVPVAVITNGTLFSLPRVREALCRADVVLPSLVAAEPSMFHRIARPIGQLMVEDVVAGLVAFRRQFQGRLWLEIMLVQGLNETPEQLDRLRVAIDAIRPDRIHLNTVVRPPATNRAQPVSPNRMAQIASYLGPRCEVILDNRQTAERPANEALTETVVEIVARRPMTLDDLADAVGISPAVVAPCVDRLMDAGVVRSKLHQGRLYYAVTGEVIRESWKAGPRTGYAE